MVVYLATEVQSIMGKNLNRKRAENRLISYYSLIRNKSFGDFVKYMKKGKP